MLLRTLHIKNFRCFKEIDILFAKSQKLTTFVGENGSGKTAILEAINFAFSTSFLSGRIDEQDFHHADEGPIQIKISFDDLFHVKLDDGYTTQDVPCVGIELEIHRREKGSPGKALSDGFVVTRSFEPDSSVKKTESGWELIRKNGKPFTFTKRALSQAHADDLPRCFYFNKDRENQAKIGFNSTLQRIADEFDWRFRSNIKPHRDTYLEKWESLKDTILESIDSNKIRETIEPVREELVGLLGKKYEHLELSIFNLEQPFAKSFFSLRYQLNQTDLARLGSGVSTILAYLLLETISGLSKQSLIILIDEPELHLHHQLRMKFRDRLKASESQVIISTHADDMVDVGDWKSVKRIDGMQQCFPQVDTLKREIDSKAVADHLIELAKFYQDKLVLTKENNTLFFARKCVLVEGPTDKYAIEVLGAREEIGIEDVTVISCNSKDKIKFYQLLCVAFEIPYFILFDMDGEPAASTKNAGVIGLASEDDFFGFKETITEALGVPKSAPKSATMLAIDDYGKLEGELKKALSKIKKFAKK